VVTMQNKPAEQARVLRGKHAEREQRRNEGGDEDEPSGDVEQTERRLFGIHV